MLTCKPFIHLSFRRFFYLLLSNVAVSCDSSEACHMVRWLTKTTMSDSWQTISFPLHQTSHIWTALSGRTFYSWTTLSDRTSHRWSSISDWTSHTWPHIAEQTPLVQVKPKEFNHGTGWWWNSKMIDKPPLFIYHKLLIEIHSTKTSQAATALGSQFHHNIMKSWDLLLSYLSILWIDQKKKSTRWYKSEMRL